MLIMIVVMLPTFQAFSSRSTHLAVGHGRGPLPHRFLRHDEGLQEPVYEVMSYLGGARPSWRPDAVAWPWLVTGNQGRFKDGAGDF